MSDDGEDMPSSDVERDHLCGVRILRRPRKQVALLMSLGIVNGSRSGTGFELRGDFVLVVRAP